MGILKKMVQNVEQTKGMYRNEERQSQFLFA